MHEKTLLLRQVHPMFIQGDEITSQVFKPTPKDNLKLSVYNGDMISAAKAYHHYTAELKFPSIGVVAVSRKECDEITISVEEDGIPFKEHCSLLFEGYSKGQIERYAVRLKMFAQLRGFLFK